MNSKFFDLSKEKQDKMLNAALKVFATNGYKQASTDIIVKEAKISKGLLFHYFENKISLYEFVYEYSIRYLMMVNENAIIAKSIDFFELIRMIEKCKLRTIYRYPYMIQFLNQVDIEPMEEIKERIKGTRKIFDMHIQTILKKANYDRIPQGVDVDKLYYILKHTLDSLFILEEKTKSKTVESWYEEIDSYITLLEKITCGKV